MNSLPLVTVAIPTFNRADGYLRETLRAAMAQTYPELEILVSDNCSSDKTEDFVKSFGDPRIRYHRQSENIGMLNNLNFCIEKARGSYISVLPDDDLIDPDFIDVCMKSANYDKSIGIIRTGTRLIDPKSKIIREYTNKVSGFTTLEFFLGWFANETVPYMCSTLFNREKLLEIGGFGTTYNCWCDVIAEWKLAARYGRVDILDVKASFRKHSEEFTFAAKIGDWCEDSLELMDLMCDLVPENKDLLRAKGMPFLAYVNYNRAMAVRSAWRRLAAYIIVFSKFRFRHLPAKHQLSYKLK